MLLTGGDTVSTLDGDAAAERRRPASVTRAAPGVGTEERRRADVKQGLENGRLLHYGQRSAARGAVAAVVAG